MARRIYFSKRMAETKKKININNIQKKIPFVSKDLLVKGKK